MRSAVPSSRCTSRQRTIFMAALLDGCCIDCSAELAGIEDADDLALEWGLGADKYEWKYNSGTGKCTLEKKKCGFWCKVGGVFKKIGKVALAIAPIALAPFTAGGSLALTGAAGTAVTVGAAAASAANQAISARYTAGIPSNAEVQEPTGICADVLRKEAEAEAVRIAEAEAAAKKAKEEEQQRQIDAAVAKAKSEAAGSGAASLTSNPILLAALIIGGVMILKR